MLKGIHMVITKKIYLKKPTHKRNDKGIKTFHCKKINQHKNGNEEENDKQKWHKKYIKQIIKCQKYSLISTNLYVYGLNSPKVQIDGLDKKNIIHLYTI